MNRAIPSALAFAACAAVLGWSTLAGAVDARTDKDASHANTHRASKLIGMAVHNDQGEKVGTVEDLVINMQNGQIAYAALGYGGVLGIGEKLFAVPFNQMKIGHDTNNNSYFVVNVSKEKLKAAPGFDKSHWPDFANPNWSQEVDNYYKQTGKTITTTTSKKD